MPANVHLAEVHGLLIFAGVSGISATAISFPLNRTREEDRRGNGATISYNQRRRATCSGLFEMLSKPEKGEGGPRSKIKTGNLN